jgi:hypothetical protein
VRIIEQIGSYAGLAAIPGLAVLSALYFSQARDVRRLREWAGRAPERAAEQAMGGRAAVQPGQAEAEQPAAAERAAAGAEGAAPAGAAAGAAGVKPATAAAAGATPATAAGPAAAGEAATPAGRAAAALGDAEKTTTGDGADEPAAAAANGTPGTHEGDEGADKPAAKPGALTPAAVASAAAGAAKSPARAGAAGAGVRPGPPAVGARPATAGAAAVRRQIPSLPSSSSSKTSVLGAGARPPDPWYRRLGARLPAGRYIALIVAGALVLGGGAAFAISQIGGSTNTKGGAGGASKPAGPAQSPGGVPAKQGNGKSAPPIDPSKVTVTVVNGTTIPNLARDTALKLSQLGFQIGNKVTGTGSLAAAESVVEYKPGFEAEARFVAAKLKISQKQPADPDAIAQAGAAQVIAVLGADRAPGG